MTPLSFVAYNKYREGVRNQGWNSNKSHFIHLVNKHTSTTNVTKGCMHEWEPPKLPRNTEEKDTLLPNQVRGCYTQEFLLYILK